MFQVGVYQIGKLYPQNEMLLSCSRLCWSSGCVTTLSGHLREYRRDVLKFYKIMLVTTFQNGAQSLKAFYVCYPWCCGINWAFDHISFLVSIKRGDVFVPSPSLAVLGEEHVSEHWHLCQNPMSEQKANIFFFLCEPLFSTQLTGHSDFWRDVFGFEKSEYVDSQIK